MTSRHGRLNSADDQDAFEVLHRLQGPDRIDQQRPGGEIGELS